MPEREEFGGLWTWEESKGGEPRSSKKRGRGPRAQGSSDGREP